MRSKYSSLVIGIAALGMIFGAASPAWADFGDAGSYTGDGGVNVGLRDGSEDVASRPASSGGGSTMPVQRRYMYLCTDGIYPAEGAVCPVGGAYAVVQCDEGTYAVMPLWERTAISQDPLRWGPWRMILGARCAQVGDFALEVAQAWDQMPIAPHQITLQPPTGWVFASVPTIAMVDREPRQITTQLLGRQVLIRALPGTMTWDWGHGTPTVTTDLGNPYPNQTLTHTYAYFEGDVTIHLTSTWSGQYSLDGGATWLPAPGTATTLSTPVPLTVYNPHTHLVDCDLSGTCYG